jgi:hypothetical protein
MELTLTTPALLFPTISLLLLAYTNRFIAIGNRIRNLHVLYKQERSKSVLEQIRILGVRVRLVRNLQITGIVCLFSCVLTMFLIFQGQAELAKHSFGLSLLLMMLAFGMSAWEIILSTRALNIELKDIEDREKSNS